MGRAQSILKKQDNALRRVGPQDRTVYKRTITPAPGGDPLVGRVTAPTFIDVILDPQPTYERLTRYVVGPSAHEQIVEANNNRDVANQYMVTFSATAVSSAELENENVLFVFQDANGKKEVFEVTDYEPVAFQGVDINFMAFLMSMVRP